MTEARVSRFYRGYVIIARFWQGSYQATVTPHNADVTPRTSKNRLAGKSTEDVLVTARGLIDEALGSPRRSVRATSFRTAECHHCHQALSSDDSEQCVECNWLICACDACGCGFSYKGSAAPVEWL